MFQNLTFAGAAFICIDDYCTASWWENHAAKMPLTARPVTVAAQRFWRNT
jgi:hypothetical protein